MLPFLKDSKEASVSLPIEHQMRKSDEGEDEEEAMETAEMQAIAHDLIRAIHERDVRGVMDALYSAHIVYDSELHHEGPHTEDSES